MMLYHPHVHDHTAWEREARALQHTRSMYASALSYQEAMIEQHQRQQQQWQEQELQQQLLLLQQQQQQQQQWYDQQRQWYFSPTQPPPLPPPHDSRADDLAERQLRQLARLDDAVVQHHDSIADGQQRELLRELARLDEGVAQQQPPPLAPPCEAPHVLAPARASAASARAGESTASAGGGGGSRDLLMLDEAVFFAPWPSLSPVVAPVLDHHAPPPPPPHRDVDDDERGGAPMRADLDDGRGAAEVAAARKAMGDAELAATMIELRRYRPTKRRPVAGSLEHAPHVKAKEAEAVEEEHGGPKRRRSE